MGINEERFGEQPFPHNISTQYDENDVGAKYTAMREVQGAEGVHESARFIRQHLIETANKELLDVGCGSGGDLAHYRTLGFKDATGVEPSNVMADEARKRVGDTAAVVGGTWTKLPFDSESKDYVVGRSSLHYEEDIDAAYREAARVLKPRGILVLVVAHPEKAKYRQIVTRNGREYVQDKFKGGTIPITYPRHSETDYFSDEFKRLFELLEEPLTISKQREEGSVPDQLAFIARKR